MKKCLLIASTYAEIEPFITVFTDEKPAWAEKIEMDILITGIGLTQTAYGLTKQLSLRKPDLVIQAGVAGSLDKKMKPGNAYVVTGDRIGDEVVVEKGKIVSMWDLKLRGPQQPPYTAEWLRNPHKELIKKTGLPKAKAISVNQVSTDKKMIRAYRKKYNAALESMEGAALHLVCLSEQVPFLQLRAISNMAGERDKAKWKLKKACRQLNASLAHLMTELAKPETKKS